MSKLSYNEHDIKTTEQLGEYLKKLREQKNISLEEVQKNTNIQIRYLAALESGNFSAIPGGQVYIKGFLKNYARSIGIDDKEILEIYKSIIESERKEAEEKAKEDESSADSEELQTPLRPPIPKIHVEPKARHRKGLVIIAIIVVIGALLVFKMSGLQESKPKEEIKPPVSQNTPLNENGSENNTNNPPLNENEDIDNEPVENSKEAVIELVEDLPTQTVYDIQDEYIEVTINIPEGRCWISVSKDGSAEFEGILNAGDTRTWRADQSLKIKIGNPPVVNLTINGKDFGRLKGQTRNFIFNRRA